MELIAMAVIIAAVVIGQFFIYDKYGFKNVTYKISISVPEAYENDEIEIVEEIDNAKRLPLVWARSEISCSPYLTFKRQQTEKNGRGVQRGLISGVFVLRGYHKCRRVWKVRCEKRGIMTIENATLTISDLFGMTKKARMFTFSDSVRVLPKPADMGTGELSGDQFIGSVQVRRFVLPDPFVISGAREYTGREPMNRVHWSQTARMGQLMVYNNEFTTERRVMILLNLQRNAFNKGTLSDFALEQQIKAAAFVLDFCQRISAECVLAINASETLLMSVPVGSEHTIDALRCLAELDNSCEEHIDDMISGIDFNDITDIMLITPFVSEKTGVFLKELTLKGKRCKIFTAGLNEGAENIPRGVELLMISRGGVTEGVTDNE